MSFEVLEPKIWFHLSIHTLASVHPSSGCAAQLICFLRWQYPQWVLSLSLETGHFRDFTGRQFEHPQREVMKRVLAQEPKMPLISCPPERCRAWQHTGEVSCKSVKEIKRSTNEYCANETRIWMQFFLVNPHYFENIWKLVFWNPTWWRMKIHMCNHVDSQWLAIASSRIVTVL